MPAGSTHTVNLLPQRYTISESFFLLPLEWWLWRRPTGNSYHRPGFRVWEILYRYRQGNIASCFIHTKTQSFVTYIRKSTGFVLILWRITLRHWGFYVWLMGRGYFCWSCGLLIHEVSRSHTTTQYIRWDSSGRVISPTQRPLPDNAQHSQQTDIPAVGGIRTYNLSRWVGRRCRLQTARPLGPAGRALIAVNNILQ